MTERKMSKHRQSTSSLVSDDSDDLRIQELAVGAVEDAEECFRESLPQSLRDETKSVSNGDATTPSFDQDEIVLGQRLGSGEFSHVYEVKSFNLHALEDDKSRLGMAQKVKYRQTNNSRYALKHIKESLLEDCGVDAYIQAASDLALEAGFLANLNHPNIIKLRGIAHSNGYERGPAGYFLVIDRLSETLSERIQTWHAPTKAQTKALQPRKSGRVPGIVSRSVRIIKTKFSSAEGVEILINENEMLDEILSVALQLSAGMYYMHSHSIIFRDLKPANVGFDVRGDVKIFDFGLARFMPDCSNPYESCFEMSGAGSPRYMAPELLRNEDYNLKSDVYTFSLVLWEMLSGLIPYKFVTSRDHLYQHVVEDQGRPQLDESWPGMINLMLRCSFEDDMRMRPEMKTFHNAIRQVLTGLRDGDNTELSDAHIHRRRSVESMSGSTHNTLKELGLAAS